MAALIDVNTIVPPLSEVVSDQLINYVNTVKGGAITDVDVGSKLWTFMYASGRQKVDLYYKLYQFKKQSFVLYATGKHLDLHGQERGVFRLQANYAEGIATFYRELPAPVELRIPQGIQVTTTAESEDDVVITFVTTEPGTIAPNQLSVQIPIRCTIPGPDGNLPAGVLNRMPSPPSGVHRVVTTSTSGGTPQETDADYRARIIVALESLGKGTLQSIVNAVMAVQGIRTVTVTDPTRIVDYQEYYLLDQYGVRCCRLETLDATIASNRVSLYIRDGSGAGTKRLKVYNKDQYDIERIEDFDDIDDFGELVDVLNTTKKSIYLSDGVRKLAKLVTIAPEGRDIDDVFIEISEGTYVGLKYTLMHDADVSTVEVYDNIENIGQLRDEINAESQLVYCSTQIEHEETLQVFLLIDDEGNEINYVIPNYQPVVAILPGQYDEDGTPYRLEYVDPNESFSSSSGSSESSISQLSASSDSSKSSSADSKSSSSDSSSNSSSSQSVSSESSSSNSSQSSQSSSSESQSSSSDFSSSGSSSSASKSSESRSSESSSSSDSESKLSESSESQSSDSSSKSSESSDSSSQSSSSDSSSNSSSSQSVSSESSSSNSSQSSQSQSSSSDSSSSDSSSSGSSSSESRSSESSSSSDSESKLSEASESQSSDSSSKSSESSDSSSQSSLSSESESSSSSDSSSSDSSSSDSKSSGSGFSESSESSSDSSESSGSPSSESSSQSSQSSSSDSESSSSSSESSASFSSGSESSDSRSSDSLSSSSGSSDSSQSSLSSNSNSSESSESSSLDSVSSESSDSSYSLDLTIGSAGQKITVFKDTGLITVRYVYDGGIYNPRKVATSFGRDGSNLIKGEIFGEKTGASDTRRIYEIMTENATLKPTDLGTEVGELGQWMETVYKNRPGSITVLPVPHALPMSNQMKQEIEEAINEVKAAGIEVIVEEPQVEFLDVSISVGLDLEEGADETAIKETIVENLTTYINQLDQDEPAYWERLIAESNPDMEGLKKTQILNPSSDIYPPTGGFLRAGNIDFA